MKVEISRQIIHEFSSTKVDLPKSNQAFHEIYSFSGRGDFLNAVFKFNSDDIVFQFEIDGLMVSEVDLSGLNSLLGNKDNKISVISPMVWDEEEDLLCIDFGTQVEFTKSIKFYARANSTSNKRDLNSYQVWHTTAQEIS